MVIVGDHKRASAARAADSLMAEPLPGRVIELVTLAILPRAAIAVAQYCMTKVAEEIMLLCLFSALFPARLRCCR